MPPSLHVTIPVARCSFKFAAGDTFDAGQVLVARGLRVGRGVKLPAQQGCDVEVGFVAAKAVTCATAASAAPLQIAGQSLNVTLCPKEWVQWHIHRISERGCEQRVGLVV